MQESVSMHKSPTPLRHSRMNQARSEEEEKERKRDRKDRGQEADGKKGKHILGTKTRPTYYVFHGRVTLFLANNFLTECRITMEFLQKNFLNHEVILSSHTILINTSTKELTLVNNAIPSHDIAFEHLLYYKMVANVY